MYMNKFLILVLTYLLLALPALAGTASNSNVLQFGGNLGSVGPTFQVPGGDYTKLITIGSSKSGALGSNYGAFSKLNSPGSTAVYKVPTGKKLYVVGYYGWYNGTAAVTFQLGYTMTVFANGDASLTSPVYYSATSAIADSGVMLQAVPTSGRYLEFYPIPMSFPADSYPFQRNDGGSTAQIMLVGFEK
jgi:hypothetical protein